MCPVERPLVLAGAGQVPRLVAVVFEDEVDEPVAAGALGRRARELDEHVLLGAVGDGVHGVEAQAVQVILVEPVQRVVHDERPRDLAPGLVEVEGVPPRRLVRPAEERRRVAVQVVSLGPEVVVDDVEKDREASGVTGFHQPLERLGPSVAGVRRERQDAVVAPSPATGEVRHGHQLDRRRPERDEVVEAPGHSREGAFGGERPDVELVEDEALRGNAVPLRIGPGMLRRIDDLAGAVHIVGLEA